MSEWIKYEIHTVYGAFLFDSERDALSAFQMVGNYEHCVVNRADVKYALDKKGFWEREYSPLCIRKIVY